MAKKSSSKQRRYKKSQSKGRQQDQSTNKFGSILAIPDGVNTIKIDKACTRRFDIIPYLASSINPYAGATEGEKLLYWERTYWRHHNVGAEQIKVICPKTYGGKCPICEEVASLSRDYEINKSIISAIRAKERQLFNVIDLDDPDKGIQIWEFSFFNFGQKLADQLRADEDDEGEFQDFWDLEEGFTLRITFEQGAMGQYHWDTKAIAFKKRAEQYNDDLLDSVHDLDNIPIKMTYAKVNALFLEKEGDDDDTSSRKSKKSEKEDDVFSDEDEENTDSLESEEEELPVKKPHTKKSKKSPKPAAKSNKKKEEIDEDFDDNSGEDFDDNSSEDNDSEFDDDWD